MFKIIFLLVFIFLFGCNTIVGTTKGVGRDIITGQFKKSPYRFGSKTQKGTFDKFKDKMAKFARKKNIRFRDAKGQFKKTNFQSLGYVIASNIYNRGLRGSLFFTDPFLKAFRNFPEILEKSFAQDVEEFFNDTIKQINK